MSKPKRQFHQKKGPRGYDPWIWLLLVIIIVFTVAVRVRFLDVPLERDEGEYAYAGQLILHGIPPYQLAYNMKFPGTYAAYSLILAVFGQTTAAIHIGLILVNAATIILVFLLGKRLFGKAAGLAGCASYAVMSFSWTFLGMAAHATHFVVLPALGGILLLLKGIESGRVRSFFWSGACLGLAILMKQHGVFFFLFAALYFAWSQWRAKPIAWRPLFANVAALLGGATAPLILTASLLAAMGVFGKFWFWSITYARVYAVEVSLSEGLRTLQLAFDSIRSVHLWLLLLAGSGLTAPIWTRKIRSQAVFVIGFFLFSLLAVCPGLYFRQHYFILALPAVSLLIANALTAGNELLTRARLAWLAGTLPPLVLLWTIGSSLANEKDYLFNFTPIQACMMAYGFEQPFEQSLIIADYIRSHTSAEDRLAILGSEPQIYFYTNRRSATGYIYTYGLVEKQNLARQMQMEMAKEIESTKPKYLIFVAMPFSWLQDPESEKLIFDWYDKYVPEHYEKVGVVDIVAPYHTQYCWDDEAKHYMPKGKNYVFVLKRKDASLIQ